jgi:hypothetical protein
MRRRTDKSRTFVPGGGAEPAQQQNLGANRAAA